MAPDAVAGRVNLQSEIPRRIAAELADGRIVVKPLAPAAWDWWCVDRARYHGHDLTVLFDRDGRRYGRGKGLVVLRDGEVAYRPVR